MFNLKSVRIEGFRGFSRNGALFEFSTPAVLLYGDQHQGKSSVLNALEWCLYGDECLGAKSGIRERVGGWEVVNRQASSASVQVVVETDSGLVTVTRTGGRGKGKKGRQTEVALADGRVVRGDEAEREIARMTRLSFKDFATAVYQHQESIRAVLVQLPKDRNEAIDRLLGLGDYRNVLDGIARAKLGGIQKELETEYKKFQARVEQALAVRRSDLEEKKQAALAKGLKGSQLSSKGALELTREIARALEAFALDLGVAHTPSALPSRWEEIATFAVVAERELDRLWTQAPDVAEQSQLNQRRIEAERIKLEYDRASKERAQSRSGLRAFETEHGKRQSIAESIVQVQSEVDAAREEVRSLAPRAELVKEGMALLRAVDDRGLADVCPLCGRRVPNLLRHLEKEWTDRLEAQVRALNSAVEELQVKKTELERLAQEHSELLRVVREAEAALAKGSQKAAKFLERTLTEADDPSALLTKQIQKVDARLKQIESALSEKRGKLGAISESISRAGLVVEILKLENKVRLIEKIADTKEYNLLEYVRDELARVVNDVDVIGTLVGHCLAEEARERVSTAGRAIDNHFGKICQNPAVTSLCIEVEQGTRSGGNSYSFCDQEGRELSPVLSLGDLNSLALSIFLGMVTVYSHPIGFVLMDDPSQSLGTDQKRRLVEVIEAVCDSGRQVVLATMDAEFQGFLREYLGKAKSVYQISGWTAESGPSVSVEA
ncbi:MAG TPA: AAA family ATPase [Anaerolineae bacterium]|nr:AAA family ATPase [Anaerolineae bacterium]